MTYRDLHKGEHLAFSYMFQVQALSDFKSTVCVLFHCQGLSKETLRGQDTNSDQLSIAKKRRLISSVPAKGKILLQPSDSTSESLLCGNGLNRTA